MSDFRSSIKFKIEHHGMKQWEAAKALGVSTSFLSDFLAGNRKLSAVMALRLERVFGLSAESMITQQALDDLSAAKKALKP